MTLKVKISNAPTHSSPHLAGQILIDVIDTNSFQLLGSGFYRDNSHIYHHYDMCDGGYLHIFSDRPNVLQVLNSCYAKDDKNIYFAHHGSTIEVDYNTFKTSDELGCLAKDKFSYIQFGERMTEEDLKLLPDDLLGKLKAL